MVHAERAALAADLAGLDDAAWATPSLCEGLSVRQVLAHVTAAATLNGPRWMIGVIRCRWDFDKQVAMRLAEQMGDSSGETYDRFRRSVDSRTKPPLPVIAMLGEAVVHGEDIRRPLGIDRAYPIDTLTHLAGYYSRSDLVVPGKTRVRGLRLEATDGPFHTGAGLLVRGATLDLVMATVGRRAYLDRLDGDGVEVLRGR
jgi:uncharacterized protein (TIGR03083 family)